MNEKEPLLRYKENQEKVDSSILNEDRVSGRRQYPVVLGAYQSVQ